MQIAFHIGAHFTDQDRLLKCLLKNKGELGKIGTSVPGPSRYRKLLRQTSLGLEGQPASRETQETLLDAVMEDEEASRLVLSGSNLLYLPLGVVRDQTFYGQIGERVAALTALFSDAKPEIFIAIKNPVTLLQDLVLGTRRAPDILDALAKVDPSKMRWKAAIDDIRAKAPKADLTVWCDEDTPLIWPDILHAIADPNRKVALQGTDDFLASLITPEGMAQMQSYLAEHPPASAIEYRQVIGTFLTHFGIAERLETDIDLPGLDAALVEQITAQYDEDTQNISQMAGVNFLEA